MLSSCDYRGVLVRAVTEQRGSTWKGRRASPATNAPGPEAHQEASAGVTSVSSPSRALAQERTGPRLVTEHVPSLPRPGGVTWAVEHFSDLPLISVNR